MKFPLRHRLRIALSYQRYAILLVAIATGLVALAWASGSWIGWALVAVPVIVAARFAVFVAGRYREKKRATHIAYARIAKRRFRAESVRSYCGDPCFRVVANECLRAAGIERGERRRLIAKYQRALRDAPQLLLLRDPKTGRTILVGGEPTPE